ncbi:unnamed protein product [marine sediment metagenome]|uniref:Uncharacterized protein n=1 Tax=marine sediment metagenome TaxID=412755 RepID=X1KAQ1_9ZZZZ
MKEIRRIIGDSAKERRDLGLMLLLGEEFARETGKEIARWMVYPPPPEIEAIIPPRPARPPRVPAVPGVPTPREMFSRTLDRRNESVPHRFDLINVEGAGELKEITVSSPSTDFSLLLEVDEKTLIERSYSDLAELSPHSQIVDAFTDAESGLYILHIKEVKWLTKALATIYITGDTPITFDTLWAAWEEVV